MARPRKEAIHTLMDLLDFINRGRRIEGLGGEELRAVTKNDLLEKKFNKSSEHFNRWVNNVLVRYKLVKGIKNVFLEGRVVDIYIKTLRGEKLHEILNDWDSLMALCLTRDVRLRRECEW